MSLVCYSGAQLNQEHLPTWENCIGRGKDGDEGPKQERLKSGFVESGKDNGVL